MKTIQYQMNLKSLNKIAQLFFLIVLARVKGKNMLTLSKFKFQKTKRKQYAYNFKYLI